MRLTRMFNCHPHGAVPGIRAAELLILHGIKLSLVPWPGTMVTNGTSIKAGVEKRSETQGVCVSLQHVSEGLAEGGPSY